MYSLNRHRAKTPSKAPEKLRAYSYGVLEESKLLVFSFCTGREKSLARVRQTWDSHEQLIAGVCWFVVERIFAKGALGSLWAYAQCVSKVMVELHGRVCSPRAVTRPE